MSATADLRKTNLLAGWACALVMLCCILAIRPQVEMGLDDDWSFIYIAKRLSETGHIHYDSWAEPILGVQLYLGALFIRLFGFSFTAVRASTMLVAVLIVPVMHALLMRCGIRGRNATLGTLTLVLSPLYLPLATMYMSDCFAAALLIAFFYASVRCVDSGDDRTALFWLAAAFAAGLLAGSVRQVAWLAVLVSMPCLVWQQRGLRGMLTAGVLLWFASVAGALLLTRWFLVQPFAGGGMVPDSAPTMPKRCMELVRALATGLLLVSPVMVGIGLRGLRREVDRALAAGLATVVVLWMLMTASNGGAWWGNWLLWNMSRGGVVMRYLLPGPLTDNVPAWMQAAMALLVLTAATVCVKRFRGQRSLKDSTRMDAALPWLMLPFATIYIALLCTRPVIFDRYLLPLLPLAVVGMLRWYERRFAASVSWLAVVPLGLLAALGVAGMHDVFAESRAQLTAVNELLDAGVDRTVVQGGFEYDAWTQLEATGYMNVPGVALYQPMTLPPGLSDLRPAEMYSQQQPSLRMPCFSAFFRYTPSIHARYVLERAPGYCFTATQFKPIPYSRWMPPRSAAIYIDEIPDKFR